MYFILLKLIIIIPLIIAIVYKLYNISEEKSKNRKKDYIISVICALLVYILTFVGYRMIPNVKLDDQSISELWEYGNQYEYQQIKNGNLIYNIRSFPADSGATELIYNCYETFSRSGKSGEIRYQVSGLRADRYGIFLTADNATMSMYLTDNDRYVYIDCWYLYDSDLLSQLHILFPPSLFYREQIDFSDMITNGEIVEHSDK